MDSKLTEAGLQAKFHDVSGLTAMPADWTPVGVWVRVSSGAQDEANQVPQVIAHCIRNHYWPAYFYVVHAKSAYHGKHQADLDRAVADMRDGKTAILVIWHSDRLERRKGKDSEGKDKNLLNTISEFVDAGGKVESVQEPNLGKNDMGGEIGTFITGLMNHDKSKHISEQVKLSIERTKTNGAIYNNIPWGFILEGEKYNKHLVPTDKCREYAPQIFQRSIDGDSLRTIAAWLDSESVPTPRDKAQWNESSVRWIIRNRAYAGRYQTRKGEPVQKCEAVISPSMFERANQALKTRPKRGPVSDNRPMLTNLKCYRCGSSMYRIKAGSTKKRYYYRCFGNGPQRKGCGNMVPFEETEYIVAAKFSMANNDPHRTKEWVEGQNWEDDISEVKQDIREAVEAERFEEMPALQAKLADLRSRESVPGHYEYVDTGQTVGRYFYNLDADGRREYLMSRDIRVEKVTKSLDFMEIPMLRIVLDGKDLGTTPIPASLGAMLRQDPRANAAELARGVLGVETLPLGR